MRVLLAVIFSLSVACSRDNEEKQPRLNSDFTQKVIYGEDDRLDLYQVQDQALLSLADSTLGLINNSSLTEDGDFSLIRENNLNFCSSEPFADQSGGPWCSGFLVGPDLVVTAGHCIRESQCSNVSFVFGYAKFTQDYNPARIANSEIYKCQEVIDRDQAFNGADWAVVRLDRAVPNHSPLRLRRSGSATIGTDLTVIGHPVGLPTKIAGNAKVREIKEEYFVANLDTYGGNSGSAVFNTLTGEVEGILVRGEVDFINQNGCRLSKVCTDEGCRGEDVTFISEVLDLVPELDFPEQPEPVPPTDPDDNGDFVNNEIVSIPDDYLAKAVSQIHNVVAINDPSNIRVGLSITHTYIGDLKVSLIAPNGNKVLLHNRTGWSSDDIIGIYGEDINPYQPISMIGAQPSGTWELEVRDFAPFDVGRIDSWSLEIN